MVVRSPLAVVDNRANVVARPVRNRFVQTWGYSNPYVTNFLGPLASLTLEPGCYMMNGALLVETAGGDSGAAGQTPTQGSATARYTPNTMAPIDPSAGVTLLGDEMWWGFDDGRDTMIGTNKFLRRSITMNPIPCELLVPDTVSIVAAWNGDPALLIAYISALRIPPLEY
jgi:hypothetical protein